MDRATEAAAGVMTKIPVVAKAATRKAGRSMVVVTEYDFDAASWRAAAGHGPDVLAVEIGTGGCDWSRLPLDPGPLEAPRQRPDGIAASSSRATATPSPSATSSSSSVRRLDARATLVSPQRAARHVLDEVRHVDQRLAAQDTREHGGLDPLDLAARSSARLQLRPRRDHEAVVVAQDHIAG